jgi:hypothetical protein
MVEVMEMARKTQKKQARHAAWPGTLYFTSDTWAPIVPIHVVDGEELYRLINEPVRFNRQPMDAIPIHLVQIQDDNVAIYERRGEHGADRIRVRRYRIPGGGHLYEWEWI